MFSSIAAAAYWMNWTRLTILAGVLAISTVMVLLARPAAKVVALDRFTGYYGIADNTPERLLANARAAGAVDRVEVEVGDMREMPFDDASFDGVVSVAAIDHLNREQPNIWTKVAMPFLHRHGYFGGRAYPERWRSQLSAAGLDVVEEGTQPASIYFLAQKRSQARYGSAKTYTAPPSGTSGY